MLKIAYEEIFCHPLPEGHRFPMEKYHLLPRQLLHEGTVDESSFFKPEIIKDDLILAVHDAEYLSKLRALNLSKKEERKTGFPLTEALVRREISIASGTVKATEYAEQFGVAMNIAGGTHHAFYDRGEGFCLLNDQAIAAANLLSKGKFKSILIVDLDVHQGNGTASIFKDNSQVFTFSMHGAKNYPLEKENSDLDVELEDGIQDHKYLYLLEKHLDVALEMSHPDFIFYQSGIDILATDKLGRLGISIEGCKRRDEILFKKAIALDVPVVCCMGGGYSKDIRHIVEAHANTYRMAQFLYS